MQVKSQANLLTKLSDCRIFIGLAVLLGISLAFSSFLNASLWLDECISVWVSSIDLRTAISRSWQFQGQSPLYYIVLTLWQNIFGQNESALRMLSLICLSTSVFVFFRFASRPLGHAAAFVGCVLLVSQDSFQLALSVRPYALGVLFCILFIRSLFSFCESESRINYKSFVGVCSWGALAIYAHYFAALSVFPLLGIVILKGFLHRSKDRVLLAAAFLISSVCIPLLPHLALLGSKAGQISFAPLPSYLQLIESFAPLFSVIAFTVAIVATATWERLPFQKLFTSSQPALRFLAPAVTWWIIPPLILLLLTYYSGSSFLLPRYLSFSSPAIALVGASVFHHMKPSYHRSFLIVLVLLLSIRELNRNWHIEDWRTAVAFANSHQSTILMASGLAESKQLSWLTSPALETQQYLMAPLAAYPATSGANSFPSSLVTPELLEAARQTLISQRESSTAAAIIFPRDKNYEKSLQLLCKELNIACSLKELSSLGVLTLKKTESGVE